MESLVIGLLALALVLLAPPLLTIWTSAAAQKRLPLLKEAIAAAQARRQAAEAQAECYRPYLQEAVYQEAGQALIAGLEAWRQALEDCAGQAAQIEAALPRRPDNLALAAAQMVLLWPWRWLILWLQIERVLRRASQPGYTAEARRWLEQLEAQHGGLLAELHTAQAALDEAVQALQKLQAARVQEADLQPAQLEEQTLRQALQEARASLEQSAQPQVVVEAQARLARERLAERSAGLQTQAQQWQTSYEEAWAALAAFESVRQRAQAAVDHIPEALDEVELARLVKRISDEGEALNRRFTAPALGDLKGIQQQAAALQTSAKSLAGALESNQRKFERLTQTLKSLSGRAEQIRRSFQKASSAPSYPIVWDASETSLEQTRQALQALSAPYTAISQAAKQTPLQVTQDLQKLPALEEALARLAEAYEQAVSARAELIKIVQQQRFILEEEWTQAAAQLSYESAGYAAANWGEAKPPSLLELEAGRLGSLEHNLLPEQAGTVNESELPDWLEAAQKLEADVARFEPALRQAQEKWEAMQAQEQAARQMLLEIQDAFAQLNADPDFEQLPGEAAAQIKLQLAQTGRLHDLLNAKREGTVREKLEQVRAWQQQFSTLGRELASTLEAENEQRRSQLGEEAQAIRQALGPLKLEPYYQNAVALASSGAAALPALAKSAALPDLLRRLEIRVAEYRKIAAAQEAFQRAVQQPLQAPYERASAAKSRAEASRAQVLALLPKPGGWPPVSVEVEDVAAAMEKAESYWQGRVKASSNMTVKTIVAHLKSAEGLHDQAEQALQALHKQIEADRKRFQQLDDDLDGLIKRWRELRSQYGTSDANAAMLITEKLAEVERARQEGRQAYLDEECDEAEAARLLSSLGRQASEWAIPIRSERGDGTLRVTGFYQEG